MPAGVSSISVVPVYRPFLVHSVSPVVYKHVSLDFGRTHDLFGDTEEETP